MKGNEYRINETIHFQNAMQPAPPPFNNAIRLGDKIPMVSRHAVHLNATDAAERHCGSSTFCPVSTPGFSRGNKADYLYHRII
jgi:hypothetical protein